MEKIKEIDYLRGFATIFVVIIHLTSSYLTYPKESITYQTIGSFNCLLTFAVPAFLFISALVMTYQVKNKEKINWIKFISKRILKVLSALILWSIIYILYCGNIKDITIKSIIGNLALGNASYHLYFIPLIIQLYLIFPLIWAIIKKISKLKVTTKLSFIICIIVASLFQYYFTIIFRLNIFKTFKYFATIIFSYSLPISIGIWIGFNYNEVKKFFNKYFLAIMLILTGISGYYYINFEFIDYKYKTTLLFSPLYWSLIILTFTYLLRYIKKGTLLNKISKNSFIIYLSHPLILDIINNKLKWQTINITSSTLTNYVIDSLIKFIIIFSLSYLLSFTWYHIKKFLVSNI